jgi:hypothetical protein
MEKEFGKFRSGNALKNVWHSKKRQLDKKAEAQEKIVRLNVKIK